MIPIASSQAIPLDKGGALRGSVANGAIPSTKADDSNGRSATSLEGGVSQPANGNTGGVVPRFQRMIGSGRPCGVGETSANGCIPDCTSEGTCATPPPPQEPPGCISPFGCQPTGNPGGGTGGSGGGGSGSGSVIIARRSPVQGAQCMGSTATLGDNLPAQTSDSGHEIVDIDAIWADNGSGTREVVGWTYVTPDGLWVEENPRAAGDFWQQLAKNVPVVGGIASILDRGGFAQENSNEWNLIAGYAHGHNGYSASCFTKPLSVVA